MTHHTGTHHVGFDIDHAPCQMFSSFHGSSMIAVLPIGSSSIFPLVVFLTYSSRNQLHRFGDDVSLARIDNEQVDVV
jgi:hypothetical protein